MKRRSAILAKLGTVCAVIAALPAQASGAALSDIPPYTPRSAVAGTLRSWGNENMVKVMKLWERGFSRFHPGVRFDDHLKSTATAIGALYTDVADLGLMGREIWPMESLAYKQAKGQEALGIVVMNGSYSVSSKTWPLVVYVSKDNPLRQITLQQLDALFGSERLRGAPVPIRTWGDLGLKGAWQSQPIRPYGYKVDSGFAFFFSQAVMLGSGLWNGELHQFGGQFGVSWDDDARRTVAAVGNDRTAIVYTGIAYDTDAVRPLAIARDAKGPYVAPTLANVKAGAYPLSRQISIFVNRGAGRPMSPIAREFLRYVLSREGQQDVVEEGDYLPLDARTVARELKRLDS